MTFDDDVNDIIARLGAPADDRAEAEAREELLLHLYDALRAIARETMGRERASHTLQPTALVHEAWMRLFGDRQDGAEIAFQNREHLVRVVARTMRRILVDHARRKHATKRGGHGRALELDSIVDSYAARGTDLVEFDDALQALSATDEELARVVELKVFGGLEMEEVGSALGVSRATAERRWRVARMWLTQALGDGQAPPGSAS